MNISIRKLVLLIFIILSLCTMTVYANDWRGGFQKAFVAYEKDDYEKALPLFKKAVEEGMRDGKGLYMWAYSYEQVEGLNRRTRTLYSIAQFYLQKQYPDHYYTEWVIPKTAKSVEIGAENIEKRISSYFGIPADTRFENPIHELYTETGTFFFNRFYFLFAVVFGFLSFLWIYWALSRIIGD